MKKLTKKDYIYIILSIIVFLLTLSLITNNNFLYTSKTLLNGEASVIEYLRTLYYNTFDLFPDFTLNLGNGQSIYSLVGYGYLSPITLISYLLPFLSINTYLTIITIIIEIINIILIYLFFNKKKYSSETSFLISIIFTTSSSILYTTYTSPLLTSHLLFLILSLYGVDKIYTSKKSNLLIISVFLMLINNYKYSISGIISILIYSIYRYLNHMNTITLKSFFKRLSSIILPIIVSFLCSSIILLPTIINISRNHLFTQILPNINIYNIIYSEQGLGLTFILIPSIISYFKKDKTNLIISLISITLIIISILTNQSLISYLPIYLIIIGNFLNQVFTKSLNIKPILLLSLLIYIILIIIDFHPIKTTIELSLLIIIISIYYKTSLKYLFIIPISLFMLINTQHINNQIYILKDSYTKEKQIIKESLEVINNLDNTTYRTYIDINDNKNSNYENLNYNSSTINLNNTNYLYNTFNQDILINNETNNIISLLLNNNKYIISKYKPLQGYEEIASQNGTYIYKNENTLPLGFATSNTMSYEDFSKLDNFIKQEALLNVIITDTTSNNNFIPNTKKIDLQLKEIFKDESIILTEDNIIIDAKDTLRINYELPKKYHNQIIFIKIDIKTSKENQTLKINNQIQNIHNTKDTLEYILSEKEQTNLVFTFTKGQYFIENIEFYSLDYASIETISSKITPFNIDKLNTKGDTIIGDIDIKEDSYFMITIPYAQGFEILVDNQPIQYEKVDEVYIGFPLTPGIHSIEITYTTPGKIIGILFSILGIVSFIIITHFESKRLFY